MKRTNLMQWWSCMAGLAMAVVLLGCSAEGPYKPVSNPASLEVAGASVVLLNPDLSRTLAVDSPVQVSRSTAGLLKIQLGLRNRTNDEQLQIQVQTIFKDKSGLVLNSESGAEAPWQTLTLGPNELVYYTQQALQPEAVQYTVRVRYLAGAR
jgi:hypothetical protein